MYKKLSDLTIGEVMKICKSLEGPDGAPRCSLDQGGCGCPLYKWCFCNLDMIIPEPPEGEDEDYYEDMAGVPNPSDWINTDILVPITETD